MIPGIVGGQMLRSGGSGGGGDPHWGNVIALINGTISDGIVDSKGRPITRTGSNSVITTDPDFPDGAIYFDGSSSNNIRYTPPVEWMVLDGPFSIEVDYKPLGKTSGYPAIIGAYTAYGANGGFTLFDRHTSLPTKLVLAANGIFPRLESTINVVVGTKYVIQISRGVDDYLRLFVNGVLQQQLISTTTFVAHNNFLALGAGGDNSDTYIHGIIGRFRITKGVARNTSNYTPSTEPWPTS